MQGIESKTVLPTALCFVESPGGGYERNIMQHENYKRYRRNLVCQYVVLRSHIYP